MPLTYCDVFSFLWQSVQAMTCFFDCFRVRNSNNHHHHHRPHLLPDSDSPPPVSRVVAQEEVRQKIRLSSLFTAEEREEEFVVKNRENDTLVRRAGRSDVHEELVEEARFLKACGTLPQTPAEIRKRVTIMENFDNSDVPKSQSVYESSPDTLVENQQAETEAENLERSGKQNSYCAVESSPETPEESQSERTIGENSVKLDTHKPQSVPKSPYPTPIRLTDDMQTPGTVFATNMKSLTKGNGRIRSQYVHTVLNPIQNRFQLDELQEENPVLEASDHHEGEKFSKQGNASPFPAVVSSENSINEEKLGDLSLSAWLKPPQPKDNGQNLKAANFKKPSIGRTPGDRPIIGLVATHWNNQEAASQISPKGWDGNGIPNSTTKYKEDQKVRWHATPFEERLEKALSEEAIVPLRKPITGTPISFEDIEGQDTATSHLQPMSCPTSVVSF